MSKRVAVNPSRPDNVTSARSLAIAFAAGAIALAAAPAAADDRCPAYEQSGYTVSVEVDVPPTNFDRSKSRAELNGFSPHGRGMGILGLTRANYEISTSSGYSYYNVDGGHCLWVDQVDVSVRYDALDVFIAKEYRPGGCAYRAILGHEEQHVDIARKVVQRFQPRIRSALTSLRIPTPREPVFITSVDDARAKTDALLLDLLEPLYEQMVRTMNDEQAAIDTPDAYRRVFRQCNDW